MPRADDNRSRAHRGWLGAALAVAVIVGGAATTARQWRAQLERGRAQQLSRLLATSHTPRMIESPGVEAWQTSLLQDAGAKLSAVERADYERLLSPTSEQRQLPAGLVDVVAWLRTPAPTRASEPLISSGSLPPPFEGPQQAPPLRTVEHLQLGDETLVMTRRKSLAAREPSLGPELELVAAHLVALADRWSAAPLVNGEPIPGATLVLSQPRLTRLYVMVEDGTYMAVAFPEAGDRSDARVRAAALAKETQQSWRRPHDPSLVSNSLFSVFDERQPVAEQVHYTGIYPDVAGYGFVATLAVPVVVANGELELILAADLSVEVSLDRLVEAADSSLELVVTEPVREVEALMWQPWSTLVTSIGADAPEQLRHAVQLAVLRETREEIWVPQRPLVHSRSEHGVLFAQQVDRQRWMVGWLAQTPPSMPWVPMLLVPGLLLGLLLWADRRGARLATQRDAARELLEQRKHLLDVLDLPLVVVDPNDDTIVAANPAATRELGASPGRVFHEQLVAAEPRSQQHYHERQVLAGGRRRAYGVYLRGEDPSELRYALIRSISLSEAQPELGASANHRIGLICPIEGEADLSLVLADERTGARKDERNKLAAILEHGADTLARVLASQLRVEPPGEREFCRWLAEYLLGRLHVTQWVLDRWGGPVTGEVDCILGPEHLHGALAQYEAIFAIVGRDPGLRAQLHWHNGTLAEPLPGPGVIRSFIDWPAEYRLTVPADGLFGYFLGEVLVNAIKHGTPGRAIELEVDVDRVRRELGLVLRNHAPAAPGERAAKAYGGMAIVAELARLCGWTLTEGRDDELFELRWTCPLTLQRPAGEVD